MTRSVDLAGFAVAVRVTTLTRKNELAVLPVIPGLRKSQLVSMASGYDDPNRVASKLRDKNHVAFLNIRVRKRMSFGNQDFHPRHATAGTFASFPALGEAHILAAGLPVLSTSTVRAVRCGAASRPDSKLTENPNFAPQQSTDPEEDAC